jgi:ribonuclease VapC
MIVVDTSALMAIVLKEAKGEACRQAVEGETEVLVSAGTVAEALIVAAGRQVEGKIERLIDELGFEIATVTATFARRIAEAYGQWGKGVHPAGLNFGDCFAYALAKERSCPLLFVGNEFSKTDIESVL